MVLLGEKCGKYGIQYYITVGKLVLYNNNYNISRIALNENSQILICNIHF